MIRVHRHVRRRAAKQKLPVFCPLPEPRGALIGIVSEETTPQRFIKKYGFNDHRKALVDGLFETLRLYQAAGMNVLEVSVYGSFVSKKEHPGDLDVLLHAHDLFWLSDDVRERIREFEAGHDIEVLYAVNDRTYCKFLNWAQVRHGKIVRFQPRGDDD